eukprot:CAMPEP_0198495374 /NCGR_PEP_ID=MMETSP1462-20131121/5163_1 /TAXON_ID=1333877 /ORGANISM="Brandtodinium nutriculum, Strain RCC3387" /LENGTH=349 /DNA_ID=CAMNT_0044224147 /DNA_START=86 /DNA_END=1132 /DNA_ORIENTATION=-
MAHMQQDQESKTVQKGVVALLQEFIQCSRQFSAPQHRPILQWSYDQRMVNTTALEFRGIVAFLLDGVPHHVAGGWHPSKKLAQRDAAERSLAFFVGKWGEQLLLDETKPTKAVDVSAGASDVQALAEYCRSHSACGGDVPKWSHSWSGGECTATVQVSLLGVPHKFGGAAKPDKDAAYADAARRVLWYFQCPGYQSLFAPDPRSQAVMAKEIPAPPSNWACDGAEIEELRTAERKTILMRVQNRLQQEFAKQLKPGQSVWNWAYETDESDTEWPPLCRAKVEVSTIGRTFVGGWIRGQREAQVEAGLLVADYLDRGCGGRETRAPSSSSDVGSEWSSEDGSGRIGRWCD